MKVLILPSWYPTLEDKINGSFFHEQAQLLHNKTDSEIKVLVCRFPIRPKTWNLRKPIQTFLSVMRVLLQTPIRIKPQDQEIFTAPPLIEFHQATLNPIKRLRHRKRIHTYLKAYEQILTSGWKPDILHAHSVKMAGLAAYYISKKHNIPYVITEHSPFHLSNFPKFMRTDVRNTFIHADQVLSLSYDKVRQLGINNIHVEPNLIYNFVDEQIFNNTCQRYQPGELLKLITIGAASPLKDHPTLFRALQRLKQRDIPFHLTMVGLKTWGDGYQSTIKTITEMGLKDNVTIVDKANRCDIPGYLEQNNCFVITSVAEGLPVSVLEAQACGLFVIATRHGGTEDIIQPHTGAIAEVKNHRKVADHLEKFYSGHFKHAPQLIRQSIIKTCGSAAFSQRQTNFYQQAINCHRKQHQKQEGIS